ncbi:MAG TPA: hypothetical protein VGJ66_11570 [Pyrinomonadaceae bacterium]
MNRAFLAEFGYYESRRSLVKLSPFTGSWSNHPAPKADSGQLHHRQSLRVTNYAETKYLVTHTLFTIEPS